MGRRRRLAHCRLAKTAKKGYFVRCCSHTDPAHTYWYIEAVPELLELASKRVEEVQP